MIGIASVLGFRFEKDELLFVYPFENNQTKFIGGEIDALVRAGLLRVTKGVGREQIYSFENQQLMQVAYSRLTFAKRLELHERCAEWFQTLEREQKKDRTKVNQERCNNAKLAFHIFMILQQANDKSIAVHERVLQALVNATEEARKKSLDEVARNWEEILERWLADIADPSLRSKLSAKHRLLMMGRSMMCNFVSSATPESQEAAGESPNLPLSVAIAQLAGVQLPLNALH